MRQMEKINETMLNKLPIWDQRMLQFMGLVISSKINTQDAFMEAIGVSSRATISQVKKGKQSFRHEHFKKAGELFGVSIDWFYGFTNVMMRTGVKQKPLELLKEATRLIEAELQKK